MKSSLYSLACLLFTVTACAIEAAPADAPREIRVSRAGSSSFSYELFEQAKKIAEASGRFKIVSGKGDGLGYMRLDDFARNPGSYEDWVERRLNTWQNWKFDYLVIQTLGWTGLSPEQQTDICERILPDLARRLKAKGTSIILYDRYLSLETSQKDPRAKKWSGRYPEGEKINYLLHISAAKNSGFDKISFGGEAVNALRNDPHFRDSDARILYDAGHPGVFSNYISAVNLAYLLTGENPVGNPVRELPMQGFEVEFFKKHGAGNRFADRVSGNLFRITDEEAQLLQTAAMASQLKWSAVLKGCLTDDQAWNDTAAELKRLQGEYDKFAEYGLDEKLIAKKEEMYAQSAHEGLNKATLDTIRWKSRSVNHCGMKIRQFLSDHMKGGSKVIQKASDEYWNATNSKFLEDILYGSEIYAEQCRRTGDRDELKRIAAVCWGLKQVIAVSAVRAILSVANEEQTQAFMQKVRNSGMTKAYAPTLVAYETQYAGDKARLLAGWELYLSLWQDPNILDDMKADKFAKGREAFTQVDDLFKEKSGGL